MNVLSLFDGMSCGRIALERAGIEVTNYYASEIDKHATKVSEANYPDIIRMGDVTKWREWDMDWISVDLILAGSPCQGFSFAGKQLAFNDPRSALFFEFLNIVNHVKALNPKVKFMLENVRMKKEYMDIITGMLGVEPVMINSSLVSAQNRVRYYWANWEFGQPEDKKILLNDVLDLKFDGEGGMMRPKSKTLRVGGRGSPAGSKQEWDNVYELNQTRKSESKTWRKLTPLECERLQNVPDNYTAHASSTQRYKMLGNGWTVDVISHILKELKK